MNSKFYMPNLSLFGTGAINDAVKEVKTKNFKRGLIVTDKNLIEAKLTDLLTNPLLESNIKYSIFDQVQPNPTTDNVEDGLAKFKQDDCDFVISFGGGSAHDCAKAIALVAANGGMISDYEGVDMTSKPQIPLIAINTTAGTASEMTVFTIITDTKRHVKMAIVDKHCLPIISVNDTDVMLAMPKGLTAATGMDALTHAIEAYVSTAATPITDACAVKAIELISKNLEEVVTNGSNVKAREDMAYGQYLAGMAFSNASLGYVHAMAHQLGGFYDLAHGVCNAILLPHVQRYNMQVASDRLAELAPFMQLDTNGSTSTEASNMLINEIERISKVVGIPTGLKDLGVLESDLETLAENALKDACGLTNPIQPSKEDIIEIFKKAL